MRLLLTSSQSFGVVFLNKMRFNTSIYLIPSLDEKIKIKICFVAILLKVQFGSQTMTFILCDRRGKNVTGKHKPEFLWD